jgi:hypothetical protein
MIAVLVGVVWMWMDWSLGRSHAKTRQIEPDPWGSLWLKLQHEPQDPE